MSRGCGGESCTHSLCRDWNFRNVSGTLPPTLDLTRLTLARLTRDDMRRFADTIWRRQLERMT